MEIYTSKNYRKIEEKYLLTQPIYINIIRDIAEAEVYIYLCAVIKIVEISLLRFSRESLGS